LIGASLVTAACLVISPLDEVNEKGPISQTGGSAGAGVGGSGGTGATTGGASGSAGAAACSKHLDCAKDGLPWRCVEGSCVPIQTLECPCVPNLPSEEWSDDDSILIAAFAPILSSGPDRCAESISLNYRLAVQEFNDDSVQGLPGPNGKPRHIALVICDNRAEFITNNPGSIDLAKTAVMGSMKHLTEELKVPGILALLDLGMMQEAFTKYAEPNGTLFLTPHGPSSSFATNVPDSNNLAWHMLGLPGDVADTYAALVNKIAPIALTAPLVEDGGGVTDATAPIDDASINPLRVAIITTSDAFADELTTAVEAKLNFNGKTWQENVNSNTAREFVVAPGAEAQDAVVSSIVILKPHIVLSTGFGASKVMQAAGVMGTKWKPYTVFSPYDIADVVDATKWIFDDSGAINDPDWNDHFMWVNVAGSEDADLLTAYKERYAALTSGSPVSAENVYDSAYFLIYSMFAANGTGTPNGLQMGPIGMPKLLAASPNFNVGPKYPGDETLIIPEVFKELGKTNGQIRLNGTLGPPFFDTQGIRRNTGAIECLGKGPAKYVFHEHVGHFDQVSKTLRFAKNYSDGSAQCLQWLGLPLQ
jgi:hypothetical protein